jgi:hypothetical protein
MSGFFYMGKYVNEQKLSYNQDDFKVDTVFGPTWESFGTDNVILYQDKVCYFKYFNSGTNDKVYATKDGDIVLKYDQIKTGKRLRQYISTV